MKHILAAVLVGLVFWSCKSQKEAAAEWPEMDAFHMLMAESYHPFKDSANLEPARKLAPELAASAVSWAAATLPAQVDNDEMKEELATLSKECQAFAAQVSAGGDDAAQGAALTALHERFHGIMEKWHGGGHGEKHH